MARKTMMKPTTGVSMPKKPQRRSIRTFMVN
jgi:hypothetical protein